MRAAPLPRRSRVPPVGKALELCEELEAELADMAQQFIDNLEGLRSALDSKESAMEETGADRSDSLEAAWDELLGCAAELADAADALASMDGEAV